jgi:hypothetical protein
MPDPDYDEPTGLPGTFDENLKKLLDVDPEPSDDDVEPEPDL